MLTNEPNVSITFIKNHPQCLCLKHLTALSLLQILNINIYSSDKEYHISQFKFSKLINLF